MTMKENYPEQDKGTNDSLPVIEQAVSLNQEAFDKMGSDIKFPITDTSRTRILASPKKNLIYVSKKEESPNKSRELNINDWTRPIRSSVATTDKASQPISNKSVKLRWEEKDEKLKGKYTFDLIKEPAAKRQKIVVRFKQEDEVQKVKLEDTSSEKDLTASSVGSNGMIYPEGNLAYTSQILSTDDSSKIESSGQSTSKIKIFTDTFLTNNSYAMLFFIIFIKENNFILDSESTYSNLYTFDDVVMEEEVVSSEIIYGTKEQRNDITKVVERSIN